MKVAYKFGVGLLALCGLVGCAGFPNSSLIDHKPGGLATVGDVEDHDRYLTVTGSRIRYLTREDGRSNLTSSPVVSYTANDIRRTGESDLSNALRVLDPRIDD
jgi:hypothetical protein